MKEKRKTLLIVTIIFATVVIAGSLVFLGLQIAKDNSGSVSASDIEKGIEDYVAKQQDEANKPQVVDGDYSDDDAFLGDSDAPVTIVEFSDFQCPYCRSFYNETYKQIKEKYVDTGKVKFVYRDYPLSFHKGAFPAALAAECVREQGGDDMFFAMHDKIYDGQNLLGSGTVEISNENLRGYVSELGMDMGSFDECFENEKYKDEIFADLEDGQRAGISGTPGFIINGQVVTGAQPFSVFESVIEGELSK